MVGVLAVLVSVVLINSANATAPKKPRNPTASKAPASNPGGVANAGFGPHGALATGNTVSPASTPPVGYPITGIDVSSWQGTVDWATVATDREVRLREGDRRHDLSERDVRRAILGRQGSRPLHRRVRIRTTGKTRARPGGLLHRPRPGRPGWQDAATDAGPRVAVPTERNVRRSVPVLWPQHDGDGGLDPGVRRRGQTSHRISDAHLHGGELVEPVHGRHDRVQRSVAGRRIILVDTADDSADELVVLDDVAIRGQRCAPR